MLSYETLQHFLIIPIVYTDGKDGVKCYTYFNKDLGLKTWYEARERCKTLKDRNMRYDLVSVNNQQENDVVHGLLEDQDKDVWIGLYRKYDGGVKRFIWTDGWVLEELTTIKGIRTTTWNGYTNWGDGEPNNLVFYFIRMY